MQAFNAAGKKKLSGALNRLSRFLYDAQNPELRQ